MNKTFEAWNEMEPEAALSHILHCCTAHHWAEALVAQRPFASEDALFLAADAVWSTMREPDWIEAFRAHPRIGERKAAHASALSTAWSSQEQASAQTAVAEVLDRIAAGNRRYEELFGFTYIVCATGKTMPEMLTILESRLIRDRETELREAADQQRQIMQIRLRKWLQA